MSDINDVYPLGGFLGKTIEEPEILEYLTCGNRYNEDEISEGYIITQHEDIFKRVKFEDFALRYLYERMPIGTILDFVGDSPPIGWVKLDGSMFNTTTYPELNTLLSGNILPNFSGRASAYQGTNLSGDIGSFYGSTLKNINESHLPPHDHIYVDGVRGGDGENEGPGGNAGTSPNVSKSNRVTKVTGGDSRLTNVQPSALYNKIIKAIPFTTENRLFTPPDISNISTQSGLEFTPFCERLSGDNAIPDPEEVYIPTYNDLTTCASAIDIGLSTVGGGLSATTLYLNNSKFTGVFGQDEQVPPNPIYIDIEEMSNSNWFMIYNVGNFNTTIITQSQDFPSCPSNATWTSPFTFENETITINYLSASN